MVDLLLIDLRVVSYMNSDIPFCGVHQRDTKLAVQEPNDFLRVRSHKKSEVTATNPPSYFKYDSHTKKLISLFRMNKMKHSRCSNFS